VDDKANRRSSGTGAAQQYFRRQKYSLVLTSTILEQ
jgi:hypothetical protein